MVHGIKFRNTLLLTFPDNMQIINNSIKKKIMIKWVTATHYLSQIINKNYVGSTIISSRHYLSILPIHHIIIIKDDPQQEDLYARNKTEWNYILVGAIIHDEINTTVVDTEPLKYQLRSIKYSCELDHLQLIHSKT